jgi:hypothetical protein
MSLFDEFVSCEDSRDCADWIDAYNHSRQIARLVDDTSNNALLVELERVCSETMGANMLSSDGKFRFVPIMQEAAIVADSPRDVVNYNAECELRNNLFGLMLGKFHDGQGQWVKPREFAACFGQQLNDRSKKKSDEIIGDSE